MQSETKKCQNCKQNFVIEPDDFDFYEKIQVPPPTFCPDCRLKRRMLFLNQRALYKRTCDLCKEDVISLFPSESKYTVYCPICWWSDKWDATEYGRDYDFSKPFFVQLRKLLDDTPNFGPQTMYTTLVNSDYSNIASYLKNCYLTFNSDYSEDSAYVMYLERSKNCYDIYMADKSELCYESVNLRKCNRVFYSIDCQDCIDVRFSKNLRGCLDCFGCVNLRNKKYHIFNTPYSRENYFKELEKIDTGSYQAAIKLQADLYDRQLKFPKKYVEGTQNKNVSGDYIYNSKNTLKGYELLSVEDSKYCQFLFIPPTTDSYDITMWGGGINRCYDCMGVGDGTDRVKFSFDCWANMMDVEYSFHILVGNSNLFGCMALKNKKFCILNKQYTKEEYEELIPKIKKHMNDMPYTDELGRIYKYGDFSPFELSMFAYNESIAQEYFPLTKKEALEKGYKWKDQEERNYNIQIPNDKLPDHIKDVKDDIVGKNIQCLHSQKCNEQCTQAFKIIPDELQFYRQMNLPLPRLCPNCRHYQRLKQRNPLKLWHRTCQCAGTKSENSVYQNATEHPHHKQEHCPNEFETSYAPDRKEIVYCKECYQKEVI